MRTLDDKEIKKRGCGYCADVRGIDGKMKKDKKVMYCLHKRCPYHELDEYKSFNEYIKNLKASR